MSFLRSPGSVAEPRRVAPSDLMVRVWAAFLPAVLLGPILGAGYVLSYDMVWVPDLAMRSDFLGLGTSLPRAVPSDAVVAVIDELVPGMLLQKAVLYGALVLAGLGYSRIVGPSTLARLVAVSLAVWNPFVVERLWIGHWPVLLGYAVVPWLALAGRRARLEQRLPLSVWFLLPLGSLSASAGLVSLLVLLVSVQDRKPGQTLGVTARVVLLGLAVNAPWLVAGLLHAKDATSVGGSDVFRLHDEGPLPGPLAALGMGGIWNSEVVPESRLGALAWVSLAVLLGLAVAGARRWWHRDRDPRLVALWGVGYLLALVTWLAPDAAGWLSGTIPGGGLLRDGTRSLALCMPLLVALVAAGAGVVAASAAAAVPKAALGVACVLFPVAVMTDAAWGIGGALRPVDFPDSFAAARESLVDAQDDLLILPFTSYRAPDWNDGRKVLDPLGRYLQPDYVVSDELVISSQTVPGEDPRVPLVQEALRRADGEQRASALARLGIRFVVRERDAPGADDATYDAEVAGSRVFEDARLEVIELADPVDGRAVATSARLWMTVAWAGLLGTLLSGLLKLVKRALQRLLPARKQVLEFPAEG